MASSKEYAYYVKGNKVALMQRDSVQSGGQTLSQPGLNDLGSSEGSLWKSPKESIVDGLEIQYTYSPTFNIETIGRIDTDFHLFLGWGSDGENLLLFTYGASAVENISDRFAADDWIYISGSGRWSGLHQVQDAKTSGPSSAVIADEEKGVLTLKTKCHLNHSVGTFTGTFANPANTFFCGGDIDGMQVFKDGQSYRSTPYVFIQGANEVTNNGLFSLTANATEGAITLENKITIDANGDYISTTAAITADSGDNIYLFNAFYEQLSVYGGDQGNVSVMEDESFELDLPRYLATAVVHYVKARIIEDEGNIELKEYYMKEFRRMVEKHESSKKRGVYVTQGFDLFR